MSIGIHLPPLNRLYASRSYGRSFGRSGSSHASHEPTPNANALGGCHASCAFLPRFACRSRPRSSVATLLHPCGLRGIYIRALLPPSERSCGLRSLRSLSPYSRAAGFARCGPRAMIAFTPRSHRQASGGARATVLSVLRPSSTFA
jgi:hypothetical protein